MSEIQKHIRCKEGDVGKYVLIPGDPGRARRIAERLENVKQIAANREFVVFTGKLDNITVSVCSTGIGGPSASIAVEELARIRAIYFIRVGSAGGRQKDIPIGSLIIATAAYRGDGTSLAYAPLPFPAVADFQVTTSLVEACKILGYEYYMGIVYSRDAYYKQDKALNEFLRDAGIVAAEQECATVFTIGSVKHLHVGAILATDSNIWFEKQPLLSEKERMFREGEKKAIDVALEAIRILSKEFEV